MTRFTLIAPMALAVAVLAGCGSDNVADKESADVKGESTQAVQAKVAQNGVRPQPGRWETRIRIERMEMPGMPAGMAQQMQQSIGAAQGFATCLKPEDVEKPDASFFQKDASGCTYENFSMANGRIEGRMVCNSEGGRTVMTMAGTYGETAYTMRTTNETSTEGAPPVKMTIAVESRRTGNCDGTER